MILSAVNLSLDLHCHSYLSPRNAIIEFVPRRTRFSKSVFSSPYNHKNFVKPLSCIADKENTNSCSDSSFSSNLDPNLENQKIKIPKDGNENHGRTLPHTIPKKPRRGRKSEAAACEDFVRDSLEQTFASIREQNPKNLEYEENIMKDRVDEESYSDSSNEENEDESSDKKEKKMVVEEESSDWPLDADVGWGIRASEYFEQHPIKNVVGENGVQIDWEGEIDDNWVKEINCLEWESFAFHPSPLVVLVFERYNRATDNWKVLKELEKAIKVYWSAKDRLPPRAVKIDINIERDLAYALKVRECPQVLFLRGNKIIYRETEIRTADELVHMIAYFYYKAKKPSCIRDEALIP